MFTRLRTMLVKEFTQILRDPKMRVVILLVPMVQIIIFGYAVNTDVRQIATAICDFDNSTASRELAARLEQSGYFAIVRRVGDAGEIRALIDQGRIKAAVQINHGFAAAIEAGRTAPVQLIVDGTDANTARIVLSHAVKIAGSYGDQLLLERETRRRGAVWRPVEPELRSRTWFNENLESRNYYVPGVMAQLVLIVTMMLSAMSVVREREIGTMEQIVVTPIRRWEFILGKTLPFALIGYLNVAMVTTLATFWFDIPIRGNLLLLGLATGVYLLSTLGFGLFISTVSRSQQQAMMSAFMFTFPAMLLSGFAFPVENMPESIQALTWINPLRHYLVIVRGIFLKGVGFEVLWPQIAVLAVLGGGILSIAVYRFRKTGA
ncbi:MAG: ABC transporter permease [Deltaproteobacteria bacterium]|nr:MAG: ABC transporter permease [Deltaproteobacteria bacterium]